MSFYGRCTAIPRRLLHANEQARRLTATDHVTAQVVLESAENCQSGAGDAGNAVL